MGSTSLPVIDISDPTSMSIVTTLDLGDTWNRGLVTQGDYLYVGGERKFSVIDISNPTAPAVKGSITDSTGKQIYGVMRIVMKGDYAIIGNQAGNGVSLLDVSDPTSPSVKSYAQNSYWMASVTDVRIVDDMVFMSAGNADTFNVFQLS